MINNIVRADNVGSATIMSLKRNFRFSSHAYFVDPSGKKYILITGSPLFNTERIHALTIEVQEAVSVKTAISRAIKKGKDPRLFQLERTQVRKIQLKRVNHDIFKPQDVCPVYFVYL